MIRLKENAPEFDYSSFQGRTGTGSPAALLFPLFNALLHSSAVSDDDFYGKSK
jgi:hypothetical protein